MELLKQYLEIEKEIYEYFGYEEKWRCYQIDDCTDYFWILDEEEDTIGYAETINELLNKDGNYFVSVIRDKKDIYQKEDYTMICMDTQCDGNIFNAIFNNGKKYSYKDYLVDEDY